MYNEISCHWGSCNKCGIYGWIDSSTLLCFNCSQPKFVYPVNLNYECPDCHGKFNYPNADGTKGYVCPFCGREMKGFK